MNNLHCISLPTPFPVGPVNVYLARGAPLTLIDTGPRDDAARRALDAGLRAHGCRAEELEQIILTHHHVDHTGLAAELAARSGAKVFTHPFNLPWLTDYHSARAEHAPFYRRLFRESGVPEQIVEEIERASAAVAHWTQPFSRAHSLQEGSQISFAGEVWEVYHTPGHAGGLICLWEPRTRTLLANDHMLKDISSNAILEPPEHPGAPRPRRLLDYMRELRRMSRLDPAWVLPGHGEPLHGVARLVEERLAFYHNRAQSIYEILKAGPLTLWQLTRTLFPELRAGVDFFLGLSEVQGHLDLLEEAGRVYERSAGALLLWECAE